MCRSRKNASHATGAPTLRRGSSNAHSPLAEWNAGFVGSLPPMPPKLPPPPGDDDDGDDDDDDDDDNDDDDKDEASASPARVRRYGTCASARIRRCLASQYL